MPLSIRSLLLASLLLLTACNTGTPPSPVRLNATTLPGSVHGGQQPITAATINLYAVNQTTDGGPSTSILNSGVVVTTSDGTGVANSNANPGNSNNTLPPGFFNIPNSSFTCPTPSTLVYITSSGGNPGLAPGTNNPAIQELAALGTCSSVQSLPSVTINEVTSVGAIAALIGYTTAYNAFGAANQGNLATAFALVNQYVDITTGTSPGPALPNGSSANTPDIYELSNAIATCINSTGGIAGDGSPCGNLFALAKNTAGTVSPTDTFAALINIRSNTTRNVIPIFNLQNAAAPFQPTNPIAPANWMLPITTTLSTPPTFSLPSGSYTSIQTLTISEADPNAAIYYTTDGSTPGRATFHYTSPITIGQSVTITARAINGQARSNLVSATYTLSNITPVVSLSNVTALAGAAAPVSITASSNANGSVVTFGTANGVDGSFNPATCTVVAGNCSVSYLPTGKLAPATYTGGLTASFAPAGSFNASSASGSLTITPGLSYTYTSLASFQNSGPNSYEGSMPISGNLVQGRDGNLYGENSSYGIHSLGVVYSVTPAGSITVLHSFPTGTLDGRTPFGGLVQGADGNFYGTTSDGGSAFYGTVFSITPAGVETILYSFATYGDGQKPVAGLVQGSDGAFYGTTSTFTDTSGYSGYGTVFRITSAGVYTPLHIFSNSDGATPSGGLVQGADGSFYGTTRTGGANNIGTFYKITSAGVFTLLHSFTSAEGGDSRGALVQSSDGNFYGTTHTTSGVFKVTPAGVLTRIYALNSYPDGSLPEAGLVLGSDGSFYGSAASGGNNFGPGGTGGTAFKVTSAGAFTQLQAFGGGSSPAAYPSMGLVQGNNGIFYGTTSEGGAYCTPQNAACYGTIYTLAPSPAIAGPVSFTALPAVTHGASFSLGYLVLNAYSTTLQTCTAFNSANQSDWSGPITGSPTLQRTTLTAPATPGTYTYGLQCGGMETGLTTLTVQ